MPKLRTSHPIIIFRDSVDKSVAVSMSAECGSPRVQAVRGAIQAGLAKLDGTGRGDRRDRLRRNHLLQRPRYVESSGQGTPGV